MSNIREAGFFNELDDYKSMDIALSLVKTNVPLIDFLIAEVKSHLGLKRIHKDKYQRALSVLLANLISRNIRGKYQFLGISLNNNTYVSNRYNRHSIGRDIVVNIKDVLVDLDYLEFHKGFYDRRLKAASGKISRIKPTQRLEALVDHFNMRDALVVKHPQEEIILLKDSDGKLIDYRDSVETMRMRGNLEAINDQISSTWNDLYLSDVGLKELNSRLQLDDERQPLDFNSSKLYRVFNNSSFEQGGRFYGGWWQNIPNKQDGNKLRHLVRIDNAITKEFDFKAMHPTILYNKAGLEVPADDVYTVKGHEHHRDFFKTVFNAMLNAKNKSGLSRSDKLKAKLLDYGVDLTLLEVINILEDKHKAISDYFYTGIGLTLQKLDSDIAELIMLECASEGITALPIHDSMIGKSGHSHRVHEIMISAYKIHLGDTPKVDQKRLKSHERPVVEILNPESMFENLKEERQAYSQFYSRRNTFNLKTVGGSTNVN